MAIDIQKTAEDAFLGASWQMCEVREAYGHEQKLQEFTDDLNTQEYGKAANTIEKLLLKLMNYTTYPKKHWKWLRTTNMVERVNRELKQMAKIVGVFPNEESFLQLVGVLRMAINEEGVTGRRYLTRQKE